MRMRISHQTSYRYEPPATSVIQMLRLTPRNHDGQYVVRWRIDVSTDCRLDQHEDAFGNITHAFTADGPFSELAVQVEGEVETQDTQGVVRGAVERFPPSLFLRETALTAPTRIAAFAAACRDDADGKVLGLLHLMLERLHRDISFDTDPTHAATTAAEAFALKRGVCQDLAHIFIAAARSLGIPARYVGGYFLRNDGVRRSGCRPCLGRSLRAGSRLGRLRPGQRDLRHRRPCPGRGRARLSRRRAACAARATAAAAKRWRSRSASTRPRSRRRIDRNIAGLPSGPL